MPEDRPGTRKKEMPVGFGLNSRALFSRSECTISIAIRYWPVRAIRPYLLAVPNGQTSLRRSHGPKGQTAERRLEMKLLLIVLTLVVASAAPAMALEINQDTVHVFGR